MVCHSPRAMGGDEEGYLVCGVDSRQLAEHGHPEHLADQVGPQEMCDRLMDVEVRRANPDLGHQPVVVIVAGQEDGVVLPGDLTQLGRYRKRGCYCFTL